MNENIYKIAKIEGEYARLVRESDGEELFIAMALLPLGCDEGTTLVYENFEFSII